VATFTHAAAPSERLTFAAVVVLSLGALDFGLEQTLVIPALPSLADHYGTSVATAGWLATGFLLSGIVAVPVLGRLGDLYGKRRLLLAALTSFAVGSLLCALTHSIHVAIAGRVIQGIGTAVGPLSYGLARDIVPPRLLTRAIGAVVGASSAGSVLGFLLSGLLVDHLGPDAIFWFLLALSTTLGLTLFALVPETRVRARVSVDYVGAVLLGLGLFALLLAISKGNDWGWQSGPVIALFAAAAALLTLFVLLERRVRQPLVDLALVVTRPFANANVCSFVFGYSFFIAVFVVPVIAGAPEESGYGLGLSVTQIGLVLVPSGIGSLVGAWLGGRTVDRVGPRALAAAGSLVGIGSYISLVLAHSSWLSLTVPTGTLGFATGLLLTAIYPVVIRGSSTDKTGIALAVTVVARNTAVSIGVAASFAIIEGAGLVEGFAAEVGLTRVFVMGAVGTAAALLTSIFMPSRATPST
jgi:MFS family permease